LNRIICGHWTWSFLCQNAATGGTPPAVSRCSISFFRIDCGTRPARVRDALPGNESIVWPCSRPRRLLDQRLKAEPHFVLRLSVFDLTKILSFFFLGLRGDDR